jgi:hypothetical protein
MNESQILKEHQTSIENQITTRFQRIPIFTKKLNIRKNTKYPKDPNLQKNSKFKKTLAFQRNPNYERTSSFKITQISKQIQIMNKPHILK